MTTALSLITDAYQMVGLLSEGEPLTAERAQFARRRLNDMLDSWSIDGLYIKEIDDVSGTIPAGASFTIGPGGVFDLAYVPTRLEGTCYFRIGTIDYPVEFCSREEYMAQPFKSVASIRPWKIFYNPGVSLGTCYMFPALQSPTVLHLQIARPITSFDDLTTDVALSAGYSKAICESLAEILCVGRIEPPASLVRSAAAARGKLKALNADPPELESENSTASNFYTGYFFR